MSYSYIVLWVISMSWLITEVIVYKKKHNIGSGTIILAFLVNMILTVSTTIFAGITANTTSIFGIITVVITMLTVLFVTGITLDEITYVGKKDTKKSLLWEAKFYTTLMVIAISSFLAS